MRTVFLTGGSGFVGSAVLKELVRRGWHVNALVNRGTLAETGGQVTPINGDLFDPAVLDRGMAGCSACIHLVGIIRENPAKNMTFERLHVSATRQVLAAAARNGLGRYVQMSAIGARPDAPSAYHRTKFAAEEFVRLSSLKSTILRPSIIHGPGGEFMKMEAKWARGQALPFVFMPYFGHGVLGLGGAGLLQPVFVDDVARAFVDAIDLEETIGHIYELGGPDRVTWPQLHHDASRAITGKAKPAVAIPAWYAKTITHVVPAAWLPFNLSQVQMSEEDNVTNLRPFEKAFGFSPQPWLASLNSYASQL